MSGTDVSAAGVRGAGPARRRPRAGQPAAAEPEVAAGVAGTNAVAGAEAEADAG